MNTENNNQENFNVRKQYSSKILASFGCGMFLSEFFNAAAASFNFFYYEKILLFWHFGKGMILRPKRKLN